MPLLEGALSVQRALAWMSLFTAWSVVLQALELLSVRRAFAEDGSFPWSVLRRPFIGADGRAPRMLDALLSYRSFVALLVLQLGLACVLPLTVSPLVPTALWLCLLSIALRFRGSFNGGSDAMTIVVLLALSVARTAQCGNTNTSELWTRIALGYVAAQLVLSYLLAGLAKLRNESWRTGAALSSLIHDRQYYVPPSWVALLSHPSRARLFGWLVIAFELSAPLTLLIERRLLFVWFAAAACFHLAIALMLGLNRFVWAWLAAYPALLYWNGAL